MYSLNSSFYSVFQGSSSAWYSSSCKQEQMQISLERRNHLPQPILSSLRLTISYTHWLLISWSLLQYDDAHALQCPHPPSPVGSPFLNKASVFLGTSTTSDREESVEWLSAWLSGSSVLVQTVPSNESHDQNDKTLQKHCIVADTPRTACRHTNAYCH